MTSASKTRITIAVIGVVVVLAVGGYLAHRLLRDRVREIRGTITRIDPQARTASLAVVHPKTGQTLQVDGTVPPQCDIRIDDAPAQLADLKVGDQVTVEGTIHWDMTVSANWVQVRRAGLPSPTSASSTRSTSQP